MKSRNRAQYIVGPLALLGIVSCTLALDDKDTQCEVNEDCTALGGDFLGYICTPEKVCARPGSYCENDEQCASANPGKAVICDPGTRSCVPGCTATQQCQDEKGVGFICDTGTKACVEGCEDKPDGTRSANQQCVEAKGNGFVCKDKVCVVGCQDDAQCKVALGKELTICNSESVCVDGCRTNAQCVENFNPESTCVKSSNKCFELKSKDCYQVLSAPLPDLKSDDILLMGLVTALTGGTALNNLEGAELARLEWMRVTGGLQMGTKKRPVVFVNCDSLGNPDDSLAHLFKELDIKLINGPTTTSSFVRLIPEYRNSNDIFAITGNNPSFEVDTVIKNGMGQIWRTNIGDSIQQRAIPAFTTQFLEPQLRAKYSIPADGYKVAVAGNIAAEGAGQADFIQKNITFNGGKTAAQNGANFQIFSTGDPSTDPNIQAKWAQVATAVAAMAPHQIHYASNIQSNGFITAVENAWTEPNYRPVWLGGPSLNNPALYGELLNNITDTAVRDNLRSRIMGVQTLGQNPAQFSEYQLRHNAEFLKGVYEWTKLPPNPNTNKPPTATGPNNNAAANYDGNYMTYMSLIATGKEMPTGAELAAAVKRTQPAGATVTLDTNPLNISAMVNAMLGGQTVDLNGALTSLNFDEDGLIPGNTAFWCIGPTASKVSGFTFSTVDKTFAGTAPVAGVFETCN